MAHSTLETISRYRLNPANKLARDGMSTKKRGAVKKKNEIKSQPIDALIIEYLHKVIDAELRNNTIPTSLKNSRSAFSKSFKGSGDALEWARKQPNYNTLKIKKQKKYIRKQAKATGSSSISTESANQVSKKKTISALEKRIEENKSISDIALKQIEEDKRLISEIERDTSNNA